MFSQVSKINAQKLLTTILGRGRDRSLVISIFEQALAHRRLWLQMGAHWDLPLGG
jgi:hypothetical protein